MSIENRDQAFSILNGQIEQAAWTRAGVDDGTNVIQAAKDRDEAFSFLIKVGFLRGVDHGLEIMSDAIEQRRALKKFRYSEDTPHPFWSG